MIASPIDLIAELKYYLDTHHNIEKDSRYAGNKHVFEVCIEELEDRLSIDEKMILMDLHLCYTNSLAAARENDLGTAQFWLNNAKQIPPFEQPILQMLVDLNHLPALAFYLYKDQQFDEAIDLLQKTITISGLFQEESGIDYIVWGQMEDYINIFRVHCTNKNTEQALLYASAILKAIACLELSPGFLEDVSLDVLKKAEINFINYATNDIIKRLLFSTELPLKTILEKVFFPLIYTENAKECPNEGYIETLKVLEAIANANFDQAKELLQFGPLQFHKQAHLLQFTLIEFLIPFLKNQADAEMKNALAQQINDYYLQELMIQPMILQKYSGLDYTPSIA